MGRHDARSPADPRDAEPAPPPAAAGGRGVRPDRPRPAQAPRPRRGALRQAHDAHPDTRAQQGPRGAQGGPARPGG